MRGYLHFSWTVACPFGCLQCKKNRNHKTQRYTLGLRKYNRFYLKIFFFKRVGIILINSIFLTCDISPVIPQEPQTHPLPLQPALWMEPPVRICLRFRLWPRCLRTPWRTWGEAESLHVCWGVRDCRIEMQIDDLNRIADDRMSLLTVFYMSENRYSEAHKIHSL